MTLVADENVDRQIVDSLRARGYEVLFIAELHPGIDDNAVLQRSLRAGAVLLKQIRILATSFSANVWCMLRVCGDYGTFIPIAENNSVSAAAPGTRMARRHYDHRGSSRSAAIGC